MSELRYMLFCSKKCTIKSTASVRGCSSSSCTAGKLPSSAVEKYCHRSQYHFPIVMGGHYMTTHFLYRAAAPPALLQLTVCHCKTQCNIKCFFCKKVSLSYTDTCGCLVKTCINRELTMVYNEDSNDNIDDLFIYLFIFCM